MGLQKMFKVLWLSSIGQFFYGLTSVLVIKLASVTEYGKATCLLLYIRWFANLTTGKYDIAMINAKSKMERFSCFKVALYLSFFGSSVASLFSLFVSFYAFNESRLALLSTCWIGVFSLSFFECLNHFFVANYNAAIVGNFIASSWFLRGSIILLFSIFFKDWRIWVYGEIGFFIVILLKYRYYLYFLLKKKFLPLDKVVKKYVGFPCFFLPSSIIDSTIYTIIPTLIKFLYGNFGAGLFLMLYRISNLPVIFLGQLASNFFHKYIFKRRNFSKQDNNYITPLFILFIIFVFDVFWLFVYHVAHVFGFLNLKGYLFPYFLLLWMNAQFIEIITSRIFCLNKKSMKLKTVFNSCKIFILLVTFYIVHLTKLTLDNGISFLSLVMLVVLLVETKITYDLYASSK
jgi:O-antigen/teichoic acid export membrane protein